MRSNLVPIKGEITVRDTNIQLSDNDVINVNDTLTIICYHDDSVKVKVGETIVAIRGDRVSEENLYTPIREYTVSYSDDTRQMFTFQAKKYFKLQPLTIVFPNVNWAYFDIVFENGHHFGVDNFSDKIIYVQEYDNTTQTYNLKQYSGETIDNETLRFRRTIVSGPKDEPDYKAAYIRTYETLYDTADIIEEPTGQVDDATYEPAYINRYDNSDIIPESVFDELSEYGENEVIEFWGCRDDKEVFGEDVQVRVKLPKGSEVEGEFKTNSETRIREYKIGAKAYDSLSETYKKYWVLAEDNEYINIANFCRADNQGNIQLYVEDNQIYVDLYIPLNFTEQSKEFYVKAYILTKDKDNNYQLFKYLTTQTIGTSYIISGAIIYRQDIMFAEDYYNNGQINTALYKKTNLAKIPVPLTFKMAEDTFSEKAIKIDFVEAEKTKSINPIIDMEKDIYYPAIMSSDKNLKDEEVRQLTFNLHFRYRDNNWHTIADTEGNISFWNGVTPRVTTVRNSSLTVDKNFFSYKNPSEQSDLLCHLGFANADIKYRKNALAKSFLRLSFYDSKDIGRQNLLYYATIFVNAGELSSKFMRLYKNTKYLYSPIIYDDESKGYAISDKTRSGIRVDTEPFTMKKKLVGDETVEELRLSSQFVVRDKYSSNTSSDGFYLYLWKTDRAEDIPKDIYMKVEFNHAAYGRTIPFMMPYKERGIKTLSEIVADWKDDGYTLEDYINYSYIHLKYKYDATRRRYVYYLDPNTYGNVQGDTNIVLNLYEAMITAPKTNTTEQTDANNQTTN